MSEAFVGIVEGPQPDTLTVGIVDEASGATAASFALEARHLNDYYIPEPTGRRGLYLSPDLVAIDSFLSERLRERSVRFLIEVPEAIPHPHGEAGGIPHPVLPTDSIILKVLVYLGVRGYIAAPFRIDAAMTTAVMLPILPGTHPSHLRPIAPRYLPRGISKAYGQLLSLPCDRSEHVAIVAAIVAKNPGAYHDWSSIGRVQSSQDVVYYLRSGMTEPNSVISAMEDYIIEATEATVRSAIEDVPLQYAVGEKQWEHLGPNDAIKAALILVCKQWHIVLRCRISSRRRGPSRRGTPGPSPRNVRLDPHRHPRARRATQVVRGGCCDVSITSQ